MNFAALMQAGQKHAARIFGSVSEATAGAWFPASVSAAPAARSSFTVAVSDVTTGAPRIQRDALSGAVITPAGTIRIMLVVSALTYVPVAQETVVLIGATRATATLYRVTAVESAAGVYELELRPEAQLLT